MRVCNFVTVMVLTSVTGLAGPLTSEFFLEGDGAALERMACSVGTVETGSAIFTDRSFVFHEPPAGLQGKPFLRLSIDGGQDVAVVKGGLLAVITPAPDTRRL